MTLGRQTLGFSREDLLALQGEDRQVGHLPIAPGPSRIDQEELLGALGFEHVHSIDVSAYEGATYIHDLNDPDLPESLRGKYRVVFSGGTLEHVYHFPNAMRSALSMLEPGGLLLHLGPMNNWIDHGFYQFSPTLWFDFAHANDIDVEHSMLIERREEERMAFVVDPLYPGEGNSVRAAGRCLHIVSLRPRRRLAQIVVPKQSMYLGKHGDGGISFALRPTLPCEIIDGRVMWRERRHLALPAARLEPIGEGMYAMATNAMGGTGGRPFRSGAVVLDDGRPLRRVVSQLELIAEFAGSYCHLERRIAFSTFDGSDPRSNGRQYVLSMPKTAPGK